METFSDIFNRICRVCGTLCSGRMVSLFEENSENLSCYGLAICTFANVIISQNDNLPKKMCQRCLYQLRQAIIFKIKCERNHKMFKILISNHLNDKNIDIEQTIAEYAMFKQFFSDDTGSKIKKKHTPSKTESKKPSEFDTNIFKDLKKEDTLTPDHSIVDLTDDITDGEPETDMNILTKPMRMKRVKVKIKNKKRNVIVKRLQKKKKRLFECDLCHKTLSCKSTLELHIKRHTGGNWMCEHCGKVFATNSELGSHKLHSHGEGRHFQCKDCHFKATSRHIMREHERIHTGERPFTCEKCGLTFRQRYIYKKHLLRHSEPTLQCTQCPRSFYRKHELEQHCNNVHQRKYLYSCPYCGTNYAKGYSMRKHYVEKHNVKREEQGRLVRIQVQSNEGTSEV